MNVNRLIAPYKLSACSNSTIHPTQLSTSQVQNFKQKLLTMLKPSMHLSKKKFQTYHSKWVVNLQNKRGHLNDVEGK